MPGKVDHVTAQFGGRKRTFRYPRVLPNPFGIGGQDTFSGYAAMQRLAVGLWTVDDVQRALSPPKNAVVMWQPDPEIVEAIEARGAGTYARLALLIYQACLFGLDPAEAVFDERDPFPKPERKTEGARA